MAKVSAETGQTGDWNWSCARRGGPGENLKLGKQKAEMGLRAQKLKGWNRD
jgi:hypothetical protein